MDDYCKVLIIDDEFITRQGIKHMILWEKEGFQIVGEASNGQEGLDLIGKLQPDIVLADIVMPVLNGAVDYVLKPALSPAILLGALQKAVRNIPGFKLNKAEEISLTKQLERYLSGYQDRLNRNLFADSFPHPCFRILGINLKCACGNNRKQTERIMDWMRESFNSQEACSHIPVLIEEEFFCYIFNYRRKEEPQLLAHIRSSVYKIAQIEENVLFVISRDFTDLQDIRSHYEQEMVPCARQKFYFPDTNLIFVSECVISKEVERFDYETYTEYLKTKRYAEVLDLLKVYIDYICKEKYDEYRIKNLAKNLLYNLLMEVEKYGISGDNLKEQYFHRIDNAGSVDVFLARCHSIFQELDSLIDQTIDGEDPRILEIKQYIHQHYNEELELSEISAVFNFNYHYISSYFNQHIMEGFSGYLNKIRVAKACMLLKDSDMPISDISGEVGYSDHSYFCRVFKKISCQTPSQYRRSAKKGASPDTR